MAEMRRIYLHGDLKSLYPDDLSLCVDTAGEVIRALCYQIKGFKEKIKEGYYRVYFDTEDYCLTEDTVHFKLGSTVKSVHIQPVLTGDKGSGVGKAVAGIALVGLSFATAGGSLTFAGGQFAIAGAGVNVAAGTVISSSFIGRIGLSLALSGISSLLSPSVKTPDSGAAHFERPEQRPSFLFNGPVNTVEEGGPVPLVYGRIRTGSTVVSTGLRTEQI